MAHIVEGHLCYSTMGSLFRCGFFGQMFFCSQLTCYAHDLYTATCLNFLHFLFGLLFMVCRSCSLCNILGREPPVVGWGICASLRNPGRPPINGATPSPLACVPAVVMWKTMRNEDQAGCTEANSTGDVGLHHGSSI